MKDIKSSQIQNDGRDFKDFENANWRVQNEWYEYLMMLFMLGIPTFIINLSYFIFHDCLIAEIFYQTSLIWIPKIYYLFTRKELLTDMLYIRSLSKVKEQISSGWFKLFTNFILIGFIGTLIIYFSKNLKNIPYLNLESSSQYEIQFDIMLPSGLLDESALQTFTHFFYILLWILIFGFIQPIVELRYYLIIIQAKFNESFLITLLIYLSLCGNYFILIVDQFLDGHLKFAYSWIALILWYNFRLIKNKQTFGIMHTFMYSIGVNLGVIMFVYLNMRYVQKDQGLSFYQSKNSIDYALDIFVDEVDLD